MPNPSHPRFKDPVYKQTKILCMVLIASSIVFSFVSLHLGYIDLTSEQIWEGFLQASETTTGVIVTEIRLPRVLLALLIGASLGLSGAALQGLLRNPLAEPGVIGVSSTASLGAVIALYFGITSLSEWALPGFAMIGAGAATVILYILASRDSSTITLILVGVAISSFSVALTSLAMNFSSNPYAMSEIALWLMGSIKDRSMQDVLLVLPFVCLGSLLLLSTGRSLDALTMGEDAALSLGVNLSRLRISVILGTALCVGATVAVGGAIAFVGLIVPHLIRPWVGYQPRWLLLPSALGGATLVLLADILVRLLSHQGQELMLGVMTSLIGAPFFLYLIVKTRRSFE